MSSFDTTVAVLALKRAAESRQRELDKLCWLPMWARPRWIQRDIDRNKYELHLFQHRLEILTNRKNAREKNEKVG